MLCYVMMYGTYVIAGQVSGAGGAQQALINELPRRLCALVARTQKQKLLLRARLTRRFGKETIGLTFLNP